MSAGNGINHHRLERLRAALEPADRIATHRGGNRRAAAVLMPLFERAGNLHLLFIRRSDHVESHRGQVAFPGGRVDPADPSLLYTALREAHEEVGIEPASVQVLGGFQGAVARVSEIHVTPFVGVIPHADSLRANPKEVAAVFDVPMSALSDPRYRKTYRFDRGGGVITEHPAISYGGQIIWGLTLRFTEEMLRRMHGAASG
ncbi:MAG TPA: CoA pyrophosphatase [Candidatus Binataceae bacterium]|nr:CoA pyrophosphatase [Candidatus Binataceae bacterium]